MGVLDYSIVIDAAPERVWRVYADPSRIPDWQTGRPVITDVRGEPGTPGSSYVSRRGRLAARTTVVSAAAPRELMTETDAYFGLQVEVRSRLGEGSGGTELRLHVETRWRRRWFLVARLVEKAVLGPAEARKELDNLKALVEREGTD